MTTTTTTYLVRIAMGGVVHELRHSGMTKCGKAFHSGGLSAYGYDKATCKRCLGASEAKAPKASRAPKTLEPITGFDPFKVVAQLRAATSRDEARWALAGLSMAKMRLAAASHTEGLRAPSKLRAAELLEYVVDFTAGVRLDHAAILNTK